MKKMRKLLVVATAMGLLLSSMTVMAQEAAGQVIQETQKKYYEGGGGSVSKRDGNATGHLYYGDVEPTAANTPDGKHPVLNDAWSKKGVWYTYDGSKWVLDEYDVRPSSGSSSSSRSLSRAEKETIAAEKEKAEAERKAQEEASREAVRLEAEAEGEGFANAAQMQDAQEANKSAGEYYNNAVVVTEGVEEATPVAQGGSLIVDGKVTNMTATISKVSSAFVDSVRASQEGVVLNVVDVQFPATEAVISFYMPGVADGADIAAVQYTDGVWTAVEVVEIRADHVVLDLKANGVVAFLAK